MANNAAQSKIDDWVTSNYGATPTAVAPTGGATSGNAGMLAAASSPAPATATTTAAAAPKTDINSWYRSTLGRDADAAGVAFWQTALDSGRDAEGLYADFKAAAGTNKERIKADTSWMDANNYTGPQSSDRNTTADDWGRNVLGRNLTGNESAQWSAAIANAKTPQDAEAVYKQFLTTMGSQVRNPLDLAGASQINAGLPNQQYMPVLVGKDQLSTRTIDPRTETVAGQIKSLLDENSPVLQKARADAMLTAADRGMLNSAMAASGGTAAVIGAATGIGTSDAGFYNKASDYNTAAQNQLLLANQQAQNAFLSQSQQIDASASTADKQLAASAAEAAAGRTQQMTIAQLQDQTSRWQTEQNTANSRYNTDSSYKQQVDNQKLGVANNIIQNMDLSPDRKAAMLEQLGFGTSAKPGQPGTGLAGSVYVIDSVANELAPGGKGGGDATNPHNQGGTVGGD